MRGMEEIGTPSPSRTLPSASPVDARRRSLPFTANMSAEIVNLVSGPTSMSSSGINPLSGTTSSTLAKPTSESPSNFCSPNILVHAHWCPPAPRNYSAFIYTGRLNVQLITLC